MKLIIIHGNGLAASSSKVSELKKKFDPLSITVFNGKERSFDYILPQIATAQLFSDNRLIILEDFADVDFSKLPVDENLTLIIRFPKSLPKNSNILKIAIEKRAEIVELSEEQERSIFPFLDMIALKNPLALIELAKLINKFGGQYILTMIFYLLRRQVLSPKNMPEFVKRKFDAQRQNFPPESVITYYYQALKVDSKIKSGLIDEKVALNSLIRQFLA